MGTEQAPQFVVLRRIPGPNAVSAGEVVDASKWRNLRSLIANGYVIPLAESSEEVLAQSRQLRRGGPRAQRTLIAMGDRGRQTADVPAQAEVKVEEAVPEVAFSTETEAETETQVEVAIEDALDQYHTGHGWYEVPGSDSKVRREEALLLLAEAESPPSDEE